MKPAHKGLHNTTKAADLAVQSNNSSSSININGSSSRTRVGTHSTAAAQYTCQVTQPHASLTTTATVQQMSPHHLLLHFPDGSSTPLAAAATHGRGSHASLVDAFLSRQHIALIPVDGLPAGEELVMLKNLGCNRECVTFLRCFRRCIAV